MKRNKSNERKSRITRLRHRRVHRSIKAVVQVINWNLPRTRTPSASTYVYRSFDPTDAPFVWCQTLSLVHGVDDHAWACSRARNFLGRVVGPLDYRFLGFPRVSSSSNSWTSRPLFRWNFEFQNRKAVKSCTFEKWKFFSLNLWNPCYIFEI